LVIGALLVNEALALRERRALVAAAPA
jgi:hypothetical protein